MNRTRTMHPSRILLLVFCILNLEYGIWNSASAQVYPVQVTTQLHPPYTPYLSDYTAPGSQKMVFQFRVNDPTIAEYRAKLRITIEGVGITITTKQSFVPQNPIVLEGGGIPQTFYGEDLAEYFHPNNLNFAGLSQSEYNKSAKLPEGVYRFSVEVLDYNRSTLVSNKSMSMAWIILNDPPILNLPRNESKVTLIDPTNIVFTWTARHKGSPNAAFSTEYTFRLVEIWPLNRNPYDAFLSQPPLYEVTTEQPQIIYGPAEPALIPGRKYAWQVQAVDIDKRDLFKNQGRSEVFVFQYGDPLGAPENLRLQSSNPSTLTVRWDQPVAGAYTTHYRIRYRLRNNRTSEEWYQAQSEELWKAIPQLKSDTEYEVQVRAEQQFQNSDYSQTKVFKTLPPGTKVFVCKDDTPPPPPPATTAPLFKLSINDTIKAGGYKVLVRSVTGGTGTYSGEGFAIVPWFNAAKVKVTFENIRVNEQFVLTSGTIKTYWNPESKFLLNTPAPPKGGVAPAQVNGVPVTIAATTTIIEVTGAAIATVTKDEEGNVVVHTTDGGQQTLKKGESYSVVDAAGNGYVVDKDGNVAKTTAAEAKAAHERGNRTYAIKVRFDKGAGKLGFDEKKYDQLASNYQQLEGGQYIAWKAVTTSQQDPVDVVVEGTGVDLNKLHFEVNTQQLAPEHGANKLTLKLQGKAQGMVEELLAMSGEGESGEILGKLNLVSYDEIKKEVIIVPVNNPGLPAGFTAVFATNNLNQIYQQSVTTWTASLADNSTVALGEKFDDGSSGILSNYTSDMKKVINAFGRLQDNKYYIFLVTKPQSGTAALGYMPRSKQAGFVFVDNHNNDANKLIRTIAHELGHGTFNLKHTFSDYPSLSQGATDNLMDYNYGTGLNKYQWDLVHDPQTVIPLFEGDSEGEYYDNAKMIKFLNTLKTNNEKYINASDPGARAYLSANVVTEQDLKDQKIIDFMSTLSIYQLSAPSDPVIKGFLALIKSNEDDKWTQLIGENPTPVPHDGNPILLARRMDIEIDSKEKFTLSMNGYSLSNKSITLYAHESSGNDGVKLTFFNALIAPSGKTNAADEKDIINIRKAFDITVHSKNIEAFKSYLKLRGTISIVEEDPASEEIIIDVVRKRSNNYITISEVSIRGTNIKGAALELGKGTEAESKATCTDYRADCYECKRIPAGEFAFVINTETTQQGQHKYKTLRLLNTTVNGSKRDGILIHMGDALSWTQGCLLAMYDNEIEQIIQDDSKIFSEVMGYRKNIDERNAGRSFILSIIEFIQEKEKRLGKSLIKKVIIKSDPGEQTLTVNTTDFELMQKSNRIYYSNKLYDKAVEHFITFATSLQEKAIQEKLQTKLTEYTEKLISTLTKTSYKESAVRALYEAQWTELYAKHASTVTLASLQNATIIKAKDFKESLKTNFATFIVDKDILGGLFHDRLTTLLHERVTKSSTIENDKTGFKGFVPKNFTQGLYDKILADTKSKLIETEIIKVAKATGN